MVPAVPAAHTVVVSVLRLLSGVGSIMLKAGNQGALLSWRDGTTCELGKHAGARVLHTAMEYETAWILVKVIGVLPISMVPVI